MPHSMPVGPYKADAPRPASTVSDTLQADGFNRSEHELPGPSRLIACVSVAVLMFGLWAWYFEIDEVSSGTGKVIASSKEQLIQSLEGGVLASLRVQEGQIVTKGQVLAQLDPTRIESAVEESASRSRAAQATAARLLAEVNDTPLQFPPEVVADPELLNAETALYHSRRENLKQSLDGLDEAMRLIRSELQLTEPLVARGAASAVEVLRLKRQLNELHNHYTDIQSQYLVKAREELAKANAEIDAQKSVTRGRNDSLTRLTFTSPVRGVIKDIEINTVGGVIPPNGQLMRIVPLDERLQMEVRISPRDIAYIHPGQAANVKISAYDYSIYGGLTGKVIFISPDTLQDDVHRDVYYYRVHILTDTDSLLDKKGKPLPIVPGMIATVEIRTGRKSVLSYLIKPFNKVQESLRER